MTNEWFSPLFNSTITVNLTILSSFSHLYSFKIMKELVLSVNYSNISITHSQLQSIFKDILFSNNKWIIFTDLLFIYLILFHYYYATFYNCLQWKCQMNISIRLEFSYHKHFYTSYFTLAIIFLSNSKAIILISTSLFIFFEDFHWMYFIFILIILATNK